MREEGTTTTNPTAGSPRAIRRQNMGNPSAIHAKMQELRGDVTQHHQNLQSHRNWLHQFDAGVRPILPAPSMSAAKHHEPSCIRRAMLSSDKRRDWAGDPSPTGKSSCRRPPPINITVATDVLHQSHTGNKLKKLTSPPCIPRISALKSASRSLLVDTGARMMTGFPRARSMESTLPMPDTPKGRPGPEGDSDPTFCSLFKDRLRSVSPSDHSRHTLQRLNEHIMIEKEEELLASAKSSPLPGSPLLSLSEMTKLEPPVPMFRVALRPVKSKAASQRGMSPLIACS